MKLSITALLICLNFLIHAQELIKTDWEQGYVKDGKKYSVWQYFNSKKEPELVINHTTGKVIFISKDTTDYVIFKDGQWVASKLDVHPVPIEGTQNFVRSIFEKIDESNQFGNVHEYLEIILNFDVDTLGRLNNFVISKNKNDSLFSELIELLKVNNQEWIPAGLGNKKYSSRFEADLIFRQERKFAKDNETNNKRVKKQISNSETEVIDIPDGKYLGTVILSNLGVASVYDQSTYVIAEKRAEFPGGINELGRFLTRNLKYPASALRMGLEGKVLIRFFVEANGDIAGISVLRGFDGHCDNAALEVVKKMAKWKPAERRGKTVRSEVILPVPFKLE
jgi:TonB family protein